MLLFFIILGYLGLTGFVILRLLRASRKGDSQIHPTPDDPLMPLEDDPESAPRGAATASPHPPRPAP